MRRLWLWLPFAAVLQVSPAPAQGDHPFLTGVFADSQRACNEMRSGHPAEEARAISYQRLVGHEYHCDFVEVKALANPGKGWFATAICEAPVRDFYPDVASVVPDGSKRLIVDFLSDEVYSAAVDEIDARLAPFENNDADEEPEAEVEDPEQPSGPEVFVFCEGVSPSVLNQW